MILDLIKNIDPSQMSGKKVAYRVSALLNSQQIIETAPSNRVIISVNGLGLEKSFYHFDYKLYQNYPNPFNSITKVRFSISDYTVVNFKLFNSLGQSIKTYDFGFLSPGEHVIALDLSEFPSGVYYYKIQSEKFSDTKKMILLK